MLLKEFLNEREITQSQFAMLCDLSETYVSRLVSGQKKPSFDSLVKIHNATYGAVTFNDLAGARLVTSKPRRRNWTRFFSYTDRTKK